MSSFDTLTAVTDRVTENVEKVIEGKTEVVRTAMTVLLAEGHLLIEDVPGTGKTMLAKTLARSIDSTVKRIQFTPDLLPSDVTGVSIYNRETRQFEFRPGGVFANIVVGDEINRASPKTQSALLECMEERQVTVDGTTYELAAAVHGDRHPEPDRDGGHLSPPRGSARPLHGAGIDGLPGAARRARDARQPLGRQPARRPRASDRRCRDRQTRRDSPDGVRLRSVKQYAIDLTSATRRSPDLRLGASPRASLHLVRAARAHAALNGRDYAIPDDLQTLAVPVLAHRLITGLEAQMSGRNAEQVVESVLRSVPVPEPAAQERSV